MNKFSEVKPISPASKISENIMLFARLLRAAGVKVGPSSVVDAIESACLIGLGQKQIFGYALSTCLVKRPEDLHIFNQAFDLFWKNPKFMEQIRDILLPKTHIGAEDSSKKSEESVSRRLSDLLDKQDDKTRILDRKDNLEFQAFGTANDVETIKEKDFEKMSKSEFDIAVKAISRLAPIFPRKTTRRFSSKGSGRLLNMRGTLLNAVRRGGFMLPVWKKNRDDLKPIVFLCDTSGSMEGYTRILLHFMHAITQSHTSVYTFVFGTKLSNITRQMRIKDVDQSLLQVSSLVNDWAGGTRISDCLKDFNKYWSRRVLGRRAVLVIISDGLERHFVEHLSFQMERLHKTADHIIWLNPLLRFDGFEPKSQSIRAMLPHVDQFKSIHSLQSMTELCESFAVISNQESASMDAWRLAARVHS